MLLPDIKMVLANPSEPQPSRRPKSPFTPILLAHVKPNAYYKFQGEKFMWIAVSLVTQVWLAGCVSCRGHVPSKEEDPATAVVSYISSSWP